MLFWTCFLLGVKNISSHAHKAKSWYLGFLFKISYEHPCSLYWGVPPRILLFECPANFVPRRLGPFCSHQEPRGFLERDLEQLRMSGSIIIASAPYYEVYDEQKNFLRASLFFVLGSPSSDTSVRVSGQFRSQTPRSFLFAPRTARVLGTRFRAVTHGSIIISSAPYYEVYDEQKKTQSRSLKKFVSILIRYAWTIAECAQCSDHLGWRFTAVKRGLSPSKFWGLTRAALRPTLRYNEEDDTVETHARTSSTSSTSSIPSSP